MGDLMCNNCSEKERLIRMETDIKWIRNTLDDCKGVSFYKKLTWINFAALMGTAIMVIRKGFMDG